MATFTKFNCFITDVVSGTHSTWLTSATGTVNIYLSNTAPSATGDSTIADLAAITATNGYAVGDILNTYNKTGATITIGGTDKTWTATGGSFGPARYAVLAKGTAASAPLIGYWDYGSSVTVSAGETFTVDFGTSILTLA